MRALKYAAGLRAGGAGELELGFAYQGMTLSEWYGVGDELFDGWYSLEGSAEAPLERVLEEFEPDVIHSHNLPDELTVLANELTDRPVIHDTHDLQSLRATPYEDGFPDPDGDLLGLERRAVEESAAVVAVSDEQLAEIDARHVLPPRTLIFPNYALGRDLPAELPPAGRPASQPPRIVYQGTLSANEGHYDLRDLFRAIVAGGARLDVYPSRPVPGYEELAAELDGLEVHERLEPAALMRALPSYDFGWAGFNDGLNGAHLDTALPNKAFEYVGCGLPVLTLGHRALARLVAEEGVGISLEALDELADQLAAVDLPALRTRVAKARPRLVVEARIGPLVDLYEELAGRPAGATLQSA